MTVRNNAMSAVGGFSNTQQGEMCPNRRPKRRPCSLSCGRKSFHRPGCRYGGGPHRNSTLYRIDDQLPRTMFAAKAPSQLSLSRTMNTTPIMNWITAGIANPMSTLRFAPAKAYVLHRGVHTDTQKRHATPGSPSDHEHLGH